ncbi:hypothetical protein IJ114_00880 [Candidatus Saccharibacteria bacterium]|nr:hypothetical protein [Candidatus Saccharibacteria bacterium]
MQIVNILLILTGVLTLLSGFVVLFGSTKSKEKASFAYFLAMVGAATWSFSMTAFLNTQPGEMDRAKICLTLMYLSILVDTSMLFLYVGWKRRATWLFAGILIMLMIWLSVSLAIDPSRLFAEIILDKANGNSVVFANTMYMMAYMIICGLSVVAFIIAALIATKKARTKQEKRGMEILFAGLAIAGGLGGIFDLLLPLNGEYGLIWIGPVATSTAVLFYYYAILKYRLISLSSKGIKVFSYITLMAIVVTIYFGLFFVFFFAIFKSTYPSVEIILLNFVMVIAVLIFTPVLSEITAFARSLVYTKQIDLPYMTKKLTSMVGQKANPVDLAGFLSSYLHFGYVGFLIGDRLYGSSALDITSDEIREIKKLGPAERNVWQTLPKTTASFCDRLDIRAIGELQDDNGKTIGQIVLGRPQGKKNLDRKDLRELGIIVYLVSAIFSANTLAKSK